MPTPILIIANTRGNWRRRCNSTQHRIDLPVSRSGRFLDRRRWKRVERLFSRLEVPNFLRNFYSAARIKRDRKSRGQLFTGRRDGNSRSTFSVARRVAAFDIGFAEVDELLGCAPIYVLRVARPFGNPVGSDFIPFIIRGVGDTLVIFRRLAFPDFSCPVSISRGRWKRNPARRKCQPPIKLHRARKVESINFALARLSSQRDRCCLQSHFGILIHTLRDLSRFVFSGEESKMTTDPNKRVIRDNLNTQFVIVIFSSFFYVICQSLLFVIFCHFCYFFVTVFSFPDIKTSN